MEKIIFDGFSSLLFLIFIWFLPGRAFLYFSKIHPSILETFTISVFLGLIFFKILNFLYRFFGLPVNILYAIYLLIDLIFIYTRLKNPEGITNFLKPTLTSANKLFVIVYLISISVSFYFMSKAGFGFELIVFYSLLGLLVFILGRRLFKSEGTPVIATIISYIVLDIILFL